MATDNAPRGEPSSAQQAVLAQGLSPILRAARLEPARRRQKRPQQQLLAMYDEGRSPAGDAVHASLRAARATTAIARCMSPISSLKARLNAAGRATKTMLTARGIAPRWRR